MGAIDAGCALDCYFRYWHETDLPDLSDNVR